MQHLPSANSLRPQPASAESEPWPVIDDDALHGLAGDVVGVMEEHTEADPVSLLLHFLIFFGNAVGRGPHHVVESDRHYANLFGLIVGEDDVKARLKRHQALARSEIIFSGASRSFAPRPLLERQAVLPASPHDGRAGPRWRAR